MSITVRLWSKKDLKKIKNGEDKLLTTIFLNVKTFSGEEIKFYPYHLRKVYQVTFMDNSEVEVYAIDDETLIEFLKLEYHFESVLRIFEIINTVRRVKF